MIAQADQCRFAAAHRRNAPARARAYGMACPFVKEFAPITALNYGQQRQRDNANNASVVWATTIALCRQQQQRYACNNRRPYHRTRWNRQRRYVLKYLYLVANSNAHKQPHRVYHCQDRTRLASQTTGRSLQHSAPIEFATARRERFATARPRRLASQTIGEGKRSELARQGKRYKRPRQGRSNELARLSLHLLRSPQVSVTKASLI
jgi:hypothetical protein